MKTIVGNWKMNGTPGQAAKLAAEVARYAGPNRVVLCPPAPLLAEVQLAIKVSKIQLGAQDCSPEAQGAFTGDISASMLKALGCGYVIVGHSERRARYGETNALVAQKAARAIESGLIPIVCVGETLAERESGKAEAIVAAQVRESTPKGDFMLAYEPVWAIGTGKTPSSDDIRKMHTKILAVAPGVSVLYGGSVNGANAAEIMAVPGVSGVLVGGASLKAEEFCKIITPA